MLLSTDGLPGPVTRNRLGKPAVMRPSWVRGPLDHFSLSGRPSRPRTSMSSSAPVIASNPVANTITSSSYSPSVVSMPRGVSRTIGASRTSTSVDVVAVVRGVVVRVDADALGTDRGRRTELLGGRGVADRRADLLAHEVGGRRVRVGAQRDVVERQQDAADPARLPALLVRTRALLGRHLERRALRERLGMRARHAAERLTAPAAAARAYCALTACWSSGSSGRLCAGMLKFGVRWNTWRCRACSASRGIIWMPVEPVPITPTRLPARSTLAVRPPRGVIPGTLEVVEPVDRGAVRRRQAPAGHDAVPAPSSALRSRS